MSSSLKIDIPHNVVALSKSDIFRRDDNESKPESDRSY